MNSSEIETLRRLHTGALDAMNGYAEALKDGDSQSWFALFAEMKDWHQNAASELASEMTSLGETPSNEGSFMSTVHKSIMKVRSLVGGLDASVLPGLIDGEERNLTKYDEAIASGGLQTSAMSVVEKQRRELGLAIARMRVGSIPQPMPAVDGR
jgi:uncharacterized protein (TIGR02284 family)